MEWRGGGNEEKLREIKTSTQEKENWGETKWKEENKIKEIKENPTESCNMAPMKEKMKLVL